MADGLKRIIVDVDVGIDDYLALLILLHGEKCGKVKIEAIVCTSGNTTLKNVCANVVRLLETVGRTDIPVYKGASRPLIPLSQEIGNYYGSDGFGDLEHATTPNISIIKKEPASTAIANLILNNPNEITLICLGPLTNLALAIRLYDNFADSIKDLWIMGGNYTARGNVTATAEFNFYFDPEAAYITFESVKKPIFVLTWETCLHPEISMDWRYNVFGVKNKPEIQLLNRADRNTPKKYLHWLPCDAFLAAAFLCPDKIIAKRSSHNVNVELHGNQTRGQVVLDHLRSKEDNVSIIEEIDRKNFQELVLEL